jgi:hypothetical protein
MPRVFREISARALSLLAVFGLLAATAPGCGDATTTKKEDASSVPANVKESNKTMEDYMKTQNASKKK